MYAGATSTGIHLPVGHASPARISIRPSARLSKRSSQARAQRLVIAARRSEHAAYLEAGHAWDEIARVVGAPFWATTEPDRVFKAIGVLATAAAGRKMDASAFSSEQLTSIFKDLLETQACRGWTTALQHIATTHGHGELLEAASTQKKIACNLTEEHPDLHRRYAVMLDIIFPKNARSRLSGPPSEIEEVQPVE